MRKIDYLLRNWRYRIVAPHVPDKCRILDIGGLDGSFLMYIYDKIEKGVCIDPLTLKTENKGSWSLPGITQTTASPFKIPPLMW